MRNRWRKTVGKGVRPDVQYFASVAVSEALNDVVSKYPSAVKKINSLAGLGARGRAIHDFVNGKKLEE
jgi:hypothetical protein